jgi:hypothetical protein
MSVRKILDSERWKRRRPGRLKAFTPMATNPALELTVNKTLAPIERACIDYGSVYRERIKQLGDDGLKEEPRLRTLEATVALYRANNPSASIDEAKQVVLAAIERNSTKEKRAS